ncbi:hypothetical protein AAFF_G00369250 [Aldrovandia affinis]|uniref:Uncharacterized protein n=1 Tax=Aldrovandia affinis TaxID=143900 RepID=A0AAD7SH21_9TELE|nr:hypothetical protein AAFF_G00369250 [Aldrovandia affinis]
MSTARVTGAPLGQGLSAKARHPAPTTEPVEPSNSSKQQPAEHRAGPVTSCDRAPRKRKRRERIWWQTGIEVTPLRHSAPCAVSSSTSCARWPAWHRSVHPVPLPLPFRH